MTDDLERRLRNFNPDDHEAECAREALAELSEVLSLRGMARRNAASEFLSDFEAILRSALSTADEIARLRAENEAFRKERETLAQNRRVNEAIQTTLEKGELHISSDGWLARQALQKGSRHE